MTLIEFTVYSTKSPIAINPDSVIRVGNISSPSDHAFVRFVDGGSLDLGETYETVVSRLKGKSE